jgi:NADH-quinone oxidoreductase subunit J
MELVAFYIFASLAVLGGIAMVVQRNPLIGAFALVLSLASLAGLFAMLHAEFVFILQILLYAGAIMVLVIFTIMLLNLSPQELKEPPVGKVKGVIIFAASLAGLALFLRALRALPHSSSPVSGDFGNIEPVGELMLGAYLYPFEVVSVLLLVAVVGVVLLAKKVI